jgi:Hsp20/alpha crystallin family
MERRYGSFQRSLRIPDTVNEDKIEARFDKGVLKVVLPKRPEAATEQRKIEIKKASTRGIRTSCRRLVAAPVAIWSSCYRCFLSLPETQEGNHNEERVVFRRRHDCLDGARRIGFCRRQRRQGQGGFRREHVDSSHFGNPWLHGHLAKWSQ